MRVKRFKISLSHFDKNVVSPFLSYGDDFGPN